MALVMLPCDMPWWPTLQRHLTQVAASTTTKQLIESMQKIHNMCNVGLDPDESEVPDTEVFVGLEKYLEEEMAVEEKEKFFSFTLPSVAHRAIDLKRIRPPNGLLFSLQQQSEKMELDREFVASLIANCFFSTFPKRTAKTHPTLQDFNFTNFFRHLDLKHQKCKLLSLLDYFNHLEKCSPTQKIVLTRQVMSGSQWLTLDDWLHCKLPLCPLLIKRQGSIFNIGSDHIVICSSSARIGGDILSNGCSMECIQMITCPEMLAILLCVEALEDNEVMSISGVLQVSKIIDPKGNPTFEKLSHPLLLTVCCMDAENYSSLPLLQYQQDSFLRELNKALLGFRQKPDQQNALPRRLSPIGESFSSTPEKDTVAPTIRSAPKHLQVRRKFIVLGSSGECLPITRNQSSYSSCQSTSSPELEFYSADSSFEDESEERKNRRYSCQLDKEERRIVFADRLKEAMDRAEEASSESADTDFRLMGRDGSCGFVLEGSSLKDDDSHDSRKKRLYQSPSSKYSFTTDYSSELEIVYEQLGKWLDEDDTLPPGAETLEMREKAVVQFAGNLLKRTLSESFVGIPLGEEELPEKSVKVAARSLSLELARHKNKLAAQLVSVVLNQKDGVMPVATYNWGCSSRCGEPQLKLFVQWLASSVALLPHLVYFTAANPSLNMVDTVCRVLLDRQWSVGELVSAILKYNESMFVTPPPPGVAPSLFEQIIGMDEKAPQTNLLCTEL
ncbi:hypothetical protein AAG570_010106 [Ranatra chinensis]|uniref:poly(ADP-ribose) glycohydrolase n=1 Tax=Ranatra chinensis TaxID=642074 RepID=A0ABD0Z9X9_9HEMI